MSAPTTIPPNSVVGASWQLALRQHRVRHHWGKVMAQERHHFLPMRRGGRTDRPLGLVELKIRELGKAGVEKCQGKSPLDPGDRGFPMNRVETTEGGHHDRPRLGLC